MKIRSYNFENFGKHRKIGADITENVVGFRGSNFSGKSTIATGIKYCLTNELSVKKTAAASYIRNWDPKGKAVMELGVMSPSNQEVQITKIISNSGTERILQIGNETITKAKAFDEAMSAMFGTDVSAIARLAFSPQGALAGMLTSLTSEREKLFMRVLDAEYVQAAAKVVAARASTLRGQVVDYDYLIAETKLRYEELSHELTVVESNLNKYNSEENPIVMERAVGELRRKVEYLIDKGMELREAQSTVQRLQGLLSELPQKDTQLVDRLQKECDDIKVVMSNLNLVEQRKTLESQIATLTDSLPELHKLINRSSDIEKVKERYFPYSILHYEHHHLMRQFVNVTYDMAEVDASLAEIEALKKEMPIVRQVRDTLSSNVSLLRQTRELLMSATGSTSCCPVCKTVGKFPVWTEEDDHKLAQAVTDRDAIIKKEDTISMKLREEKRLNEFKQWWTTLAEEYTPEIANTLAADPVRSKTLDAFVSCISDLGRQQELGVQRLAQTMQQIEDLTSALSSFPEIKANSDESKETLTARLTAAQTTITAENTKSERIAKVEGSIETAKQQAVSISNILEKESGKVDEALRILQVTADTIGDLHDDLVEKKNALMVDIETRESVLKRIEKCVQDLGKYKSLADGQRRKLNFVKNLEDMSSRLDRIPKVFIRRQFESLVAVVSSILTEMDTMYEVKADPTSPLSFLYRDFGQDTVWLPQDKLSGSQSVRLSLSFLIAVQRALLPNIGFMVLDEPSLHMDPDSKKQMADLFARLSSTIFSGNSQLLIFDYDETVLSRCGQVIEINSR